MPEESTPIKLPPPHMTGGKPLMQALRERRSAREFSAEPLAAPVLADLLWAAAGVNRPECGKRTAPSARDGREIDVYVATSDGVYVYDSAGHALRRVLARDVRALTGLQDFVGIAPVDLVYVADFNRMQAAAERNSEDMERHAVADAGMVAQNVYLYCASAGLDTVVRGLIDRTALGKVLGLASWQRIVLAQTVGYPK